LEVFSRTPERSTNTARRRAKVGLRGSLFEQLLDPRTELVSFPWGLNPGLLVWAEVEPQA
jgi:hypothetical protein